MFVRTATSEQLASDRIDFSPDAGGCIKIAAGKFLVCRADETHGLAIGDLQSELCRCALGRTLDSDEEAILRDGVHTSINLSQNPTEIVPKFGQFWVVLEARTKDVVGCLKLFFEWEPWWNAWAAYIRRPYFLEQYNGEQIRHNSVPARTFRACAVACGVSLREVRTCVARGQRPELIAYRSFLKRNGWRHASGWSVYHRGVH